MTGATPASARIRAALGMNASVGLAPRIRGCLFDLDGVLTDTARLHAAAWKDTFDPFLLNRSQRTGVPIAPFDTVADYDRYVDGITAQQGRLASKPAPDTFLFAARQLGLDPTECAVYEDALACVAAGRAGGFGQIVGVDRVGQTATLRAHGATTVVSDLARLLTPSG